MDWKGITGTIIGTVVATLILEYIKSLIKEVNKGPNKVTALDVWRLLISVFQGDLLGLGIGFLIAEKFFSEQEYEVVKILPDPLTDPGMAIPTGKSHFTDQAYIAFAVCAAVGAVAGYYAWKQTRRKSLAQSAGK